MPILQELQKISRRWEWLLRRLGNYPRSFPVVEEEGEIVGEVRRVYFLALHDMREHACNGDMTNLVLLEDVLANAYQILESGLAGPGVVLAIIQPRKISGETKSNALF